MLKYNQLIFIPSFQVFQVCPSYLPEEGNLAEAFLNVVLQSLGTQVHLVGDVQKTLNNLCFVYYSTP